MDEFIAKVESYIEKNKLLPATPLVVGCSGGADSMALLFVLKKICDKTYPETQILAAHVHHGIRIEADRDEKAVSDFCEKLGVPLKVCHADIPSLSRETRMSLESAGRKARYDFFSSLCGEKGRVAVAHHMEDQAESIAMHIFRGSGMEGLVGMRPQNGRIIRPFLGLHKEEILSFCQEAGIQFCVDETNEDPRYERNAWRTVLFPKIRENTGREPVSALNSLSEHVAAENAYLDELSEKALSEVTDEEGKIDLSALCRVPSPLYRRMLRLLAVKNFGDVVDMEGVHFEKIVEFLKAGPTEGYLCLPGGRVAQKHAGSFSFSDAESYEMRGGGYVSGAGFLVSEEDISKQVPLSFLSGAEMFNFPLSFPQIELRFIEKESQVVYNNLTWFFPRRYLEEATVRTRKEGDRFLRAGSDSTKELRKYMNEVHMPARFRDRVLLVARGSDILWIPGYAHAVGFTDEISRSKCEEQGDICSLSFSERRQTHGKDC